MTQFSHAYSGGGVDGGPMGSGGRQRKVKFEEEQKGKQGGKPMQVQKAKSDAAKSISTRRAKLG